MQKEKSVVMYRKYQAIHLHMNGETKKRIAEIVGLERKTISRYVQAYTKAGIEGLFPKKPPGRPCQLDKIQEQELYTMICANTPDEVGFDGVKNWTVKLAIEWVFQKYGIRYAVSGMHNLFQRLNLSYTRPTYVLAKADPEKQEQFMIDFEGVKKALGWQHRPHFV
jgi:transposase